MEPAAAAAVANPADPMTGMMVPRVGAAAAKPAAMAGAASPKKMSRNVLPCLNTVSSHHSST